MTISEKMSQESSRLSIGNVFRNCFLTLTLLSIIGIIGNIIIQQKTLNVLDYVIQARNSIFFQNASITDISTKFSIQFNIRPPNTTHSTLSQCPEKPSNLRGPIFVNKTSPTFEELERLYPWVQPGGRYRPPECIARHRTAIVIPYRNRDPHLRTLLLNLHPFLRKQQLDYGIYVINQEGASTFNRAMLMNIGFVEALKIYNYTCFVFHDVDLLPEDDRNIYGCFGDPRHLAAGINKFGHRLPYGSYFGGVTALSRTEYEQMNGCSNLFFGWGGEDDDMYNRVYFNKMKVVRYPMEIGKYIMIKHGKDKGNEDNGARMHLIGQGKRWYKYDGLNSLVYKMNKIEFRKLLTWVSVSINKEEVVKTVQNKSGMPIRRV